MKITKLNKPISSLIFNLRGQKVILDADLAELYGVPTKVFNQAVKRNTDRFPEDFMFQLTAQEWSNLRSRIVTPSLEVPQAEGVLPNWSQFVTSSKRHANAAILRRLAEIDKTLLKHDSELRTIWTKLQPLLTPPDPPPRRIKGFNPDDE